MKQVDWEKGETAIKVILGQLWKFGYEFQQVLYIENRIVAKLNFLRE